MIENEDQTSSTKLYGLLGKQISYSFSSGYFSEKFRDLKLKNCQYVNFDMDTIEQFRRVLIENSNTLSGLNVTIPYKEDVLHLLDELDQEAAAIGAVNTIKFLKEGKIKGYNTDAYGFEHSLKPLLASQHTKALILGTGGASKAIAFVLKKLQIDFIFVSRTPDKHDQIAYADLNESLMSEYTIIINCTPLGTSPQTNMCPDIPYELISATHILYDLIYNPNVTTFLQKGKDRGATIKNGLEMLQLQAEESWAIWNQ